MNTHLLLLIWTLLWNLWNIQIRIRIAEFRSQKWTLGPYKLAISHVFGFFPFGWGIWNGPCSFFGSIAPRVGYVVLASLKAGPAVNIKVNLELRQIVHSLVVNISTWKNNFSAQTFLYLSVKYFFSLEFVPCVINESKNVRTTSF